MRWSVPTLAASLLFLAGCGPDESATAERVVGGAEEIGAASLAAKKCSPPLTNCGSKCVDLSTSHENCGACGHHCPGGDFNSCIAGKCRFGDQPVNCVLHPGCPQTNCCYKCGGPGCGVICSPTPCD